MTSLSRRTFFKTAVSLAVVSAMVAGVPTTSAQANIKMGGKVGVSIPTLTPGSTAFGSWATTSTPANQGNSGDYGYSYVPIANWDTVPNQVFSAPFTVGVAAFHTPTAAEALLSTGGYCAKVRFSLDNGPWTDSTIWLPNPTTGSTLPLLCVNIPSSTADGIHELRAIVYPTTGACLVLQGALGTAMPTMVFTTNFNNSLSYPTYYVSTTGSDSTGTGTSGNPFATISKARNTIAGSAFGGEVGGGTILLMGGTYQYGATTENYGYTCTNLWLNIAAAPGHSAADTFISGSGSSAGLRAQAVRVSNITLNAVSGAGTLQSVSTIGGVAASIWADQMSYVGIGQTDQTGSGPASGFTGASYATNSSISTSGGGFQEGQLVRGCNVSHVGGDAYSETQFVLDCACDHIDRLGDTYFHPDVWQNQNIATNGLVYGMNCGAGMNTDLVFNDVNSAAVNNWAVVNVPNFNNAGGEFYYALETSRPMTNAFLMNVTLTGTGPIYANTITLTWLRCTFNAGTPPAYSGVRYLP